MLEGGQGGSKCRCRTYMQVQDTAGHNDACENLAVCGGKDDSCRLTCQRVGCGIVRVVCCWQQLKNTIMMQEYRCPNNAVVAARQVSRLGAQLNSYSLRAVSDLPDRVICLVPFHPEPLLASKVVSPQAAMRICYMPAMPLLPLCLLSLLLLLLRCLLLL